MPWSHREDLKGWAAASCVGDPSVEISQVLLQGLLPHPLNFVNVLYTRRDLTLPFSVLESHEVLICLTALTEIFLTYYQRQGKSDKGIGKRAAVRPQYKTPK